MLSFKTYIATISLALTLAFSSAQQTIGTFVNEAEALNAYTLFSVTFGKATYLVDNCGEVINNWTHEYRAGLAAYMLPDGRLLRSSRINHPVISQTSQGGLLEIYSWDGDLEWSYDFSDARRTQHHDLHYMANGNILVLAWEHLSTSEVRNLGRNTDDYNPRPLYTEAVYEIKPIYPDSAEIVWEWHLKDHYVQDFDDTKVNYVADISAHPGKYDFNFQGLSSWSETDWTHCNAMDYNPTRDEILINCRNGNEFWIIDHSTTTAQAATDTGGNYGRGGDFIYRWGNPYAYQRGSRFQAKLYGAHGLEWIPEGRPYAGSIIAFNNGAERPGTNYSTIEIITPAVDSNGRYIMEIDGPYQPELATTTWEHDPRIEFYSQYQSNAQFLPNGNLFTNRGDYGHFTEFDSAGNVVWDYINPAGWLGPANQGQIPQSSSVFIATRLPVDHMAFDGKDLTPKGLIEMNSDYTDCELFTSNRNIQNHVDIQISYNRSLALLTVSHNEGTSFEIKVYDIQGKEFHYQKSSQSFAQCSTALWTDGVYIVTVIDENQQVRISRFIK